MNSLADNLFDLNLPLSTQPNFKPFFLPNTSNTFFIGRIQKPRITLLIKPEIANSFLQSERSKSPFNNKESFSQISKSSPAMRSNSKNIDATQKNGLNLTNELKYNIFKCKEEKNIAICSKFPILGKHINDIVNCLNDLKLFNQTKLNSFYLFKFDQIFIETDSISTIFDTSFMNLIKSIMGGKSACAFLLGPHK